MSKDIKLSKKYGLNPTMPVCFFCGEEKGEIALLGKIGKGKEDIEAPRHMIMDYEPCDKCKERMALGVTLIGVKSEEPSDGRPEIACFDGVNQYPTGAWVVVSDNFVKNNIKPKELADGILRERKALTPHDLVIWIQEQYEEMKKDEE